MITIIQIQVDSSKKYSQELRWIYRYFISRLMGQIKMFDSGYIKTTVVFEDDKLGEPGKR